ncbi:unnamed protein product [Auanema sp. JU1783]|nr:unnamed protein product [Auanema sp. JU1783]
MKSFVFALFLFSSTVSACTSWPNNTDTQFNWWQCATGGMSFFNVTPYDASAKKYEYPIHLGHPLLLETEAYMPEKYDRPNLKLTVSVFTWNTNSCAWSSLPTFGLLKEMNACDNGISCPVPAGSHSFNIELDFSKHETIINMLKDDSPYQLQFVFDNARTKNIGCLLTQARARIH